MRKTSLSLVAKPSDYEALARGVISLKENSKLAQMMGEDGRKYAENDLSVEIIGSRMR